MIIAIIVAVGITSCSGNPGELSFTVTYITGGNGMIEGEANQSVTPGGNTTEVTAVPGEGYQFAGWSDGIKTATRRDNNVKSSMTVTAVFEKVNFTVAYAVEGNGSIKGKADQTIAYGENSTAVTAVWSDLFSWVVSTPRARASPPPPPARAGPVPPDV